jgi:hypothetical protein
MKKLLILIAAFLLSSNGISQTCVKIDSIYSTAKVRELGNRDIRFGVKQILEDQLSNKFCLSESGEKIGVEIYYFGVPKKSLRVVGVERTNQTTQIGIKLYFMDKVYEGIGEADTEVRAAFIELVDGKVPFSKMTVSIAIKKAIEECISKIQ